jgi:hypothetical protein
VDRFSTAAWGVVVVLGLAAIALVLPATWLEWTDQHPGAAAWAQAILSAAAVLAAVWLQARIRQADKAERVEREAADQAARSDREIAVLLALSQSALHVLEQVEQTVRESQYAGQTRRFLRAQLVAELDGLNRIDGFAVGSVDAVLTVKTLALKVSAAMFLLDAYVISGGSQLDGTVAAIARVVEEARAAVADLRTLRRPGAA